MLWRHPASSTQNIALLAIWAVFFSSFAKLLLKGGRCSLHQSTIRADESLVVDAQHCTPLAEDGYWAGADDDHLAIWQPNGCTTAVYQASDIKECIGNNSITMYGDSTVRQVFWAISEKLKAEVNRSARHDEHQFAQGSGVKLDFEWDVYLESPQLYELMEQKRTGAETDVSILLVGAGLHFAAWRNESAYFNDFTTTMNKLYQPQVEVATDSDMAVYVMPVLPAWYQYIRKETRQVTAEKVGQMNDWIMNEMQKSVVPSFKKTYLWAYNKMVLTNRKAYDQSAIHVIEPVAHQKADILLNHYCNPILAKKGKLPKNASCCVPSGPRQTGQYATLAATFCLIIAGLVSLWRLRTDAETKRADVFVSKETGQAFLFFCSALLFCFATDQTQAFGKLLKQHDKAQFGLLSLLSLTIVLLPIVIKLTRSQLNSAGQATFVEKRLDSSFLSHGHTDEWKGWMQAIILLYHWTGASTNLSVYKFIRLLVASYLFMSGYGTTLAVLKTDEGLIKKMCRQLIRLNILSVALSYMMATSYLDYYFAPLVSMLLLATYACLGFFKSWNSNLKLVCLKIAICCSITTFLLFKDGIVEGVFYLLSHTCNISLDAKEWRFRAGLDAFIVYAGILTAVVAANIRSADQDLEDGNKEGYTETGRTRRWHAVVSWCKSRSTLTTTSASILAGTALIAIWVVLARSKGSKASYNAIHPYISPLPVLGFVSLRHCHPYLRAKHSSLFARLGRCSLETFTLQFHLLLANNTAATLSLSFFSHLPRLRLVRIVELCLVMLTLFFISEKVAQASGVLVSLVSDFAWTSKATLQDDYASVAQDESRDEEASPSSSTESLHSSSVHSGSLMNVQTSKGQSYRRISISKIPCLLWPYHYHRIVAASAIFIIFNWAGYTRIN